MHSRKILPLLVLSLLTVSCSSMSLYQNKLVEEAHVTDQTRAGKLLVSLPAPQEKLFVSVYDFQDLTGQFRNNEKYTDYSSAVTKGGHALLMKALMDAGDKQWFSVLDRNGLKDILQERNIIDVMRNQYRAPDGSKLAPLDPLAYSGLVIEGGIVSYDSNVITGGAGATYLGLNSNAKYNRDMVTVSLRAVSVKTGEVLVSVTSSKTIFSTSLDTNLLKYVTFDRLLDAEAGFSVNEPVQLAVRQAVETGVYSLIMEGAQDKLWAFKDPAAGQQALHDYMIRRDGKGAVASADKQRQAEIDAIAKQAAEAEEAGKRAKEQQMAEAAPVQAAQAADLAPAAGGNPPADSSKLPPELAETVMPPAKNQQPTSVADNDNVIQKLKASDVSEMAPASGQPAPQQQPQAQPMPQPSRMSDSAYEDRRKLVMPSEDPNFNSAPAGRH